MNKYLTFLLRAALVFAAVSYANIFACWDEADWGSGFGFMGGTDGSNGGFGGTGYYNQGGHITILDFPPAPLTGVTGPTMGGGGGGGGILTPPPTGTTDPGSNGGTVTVITDPTSGGDTQPPPVTPGNTKLIITGPSGTVKLNP